MRLIFNFSINLTLLSLVITFPETDIEPFDKICYNLTLFQEKGGYDEPY